MTQRVQCGWAIPCGRPVGGTYHAPFYRQFHSPAGGLTALLPLPLLSLLFARMQLPESAFQATSHDAAHDAFMTLSSYSSSREDEACYLEIGPKHCRVGL